MSYYDSSDTNKFGERVLTAGVVVLAALGALIFHTQKNNYNKQNNPEFNEKLSKTPATLVAKNLSSAEHVGELYYSTDENPDTIEAYMAVPVENLSQRVHFMEVKPGKTQSLLDWKKEFQPANVKRSSPFIKTVFLGKSK